MRDMDEIVKFSMFLDDCPAESGAVDCGVGAQLHVVFDLHPTQLGDLFRFPVDSFVAETVAADDNAGVKNDAVSHLAAFENGRTRIDFAVAPHGHRTADVNLRIENSIRADDGILFYHAQGADMSGFVN